MDFSDAYLKTLGIIVALLMGSVALANWLNRRHGGFMKGWAGALFIAVCWSAGMVFIFLKVHGDG